MISLKDVDLQRGVNKLLHKANLMIHRGEKVALVGANGAGKSSLFKLLLGNLQADAGDVQLNQGIRTAHMAQEVDATERSALDYVLDGDHKLRELQQQIQQAEEQQDNNRLAKLYSELEQIEGYSANTRAEQMLDGLGFKPEQMSLPVKGFSGGWRIRLNLAQALMCPSDLMLLDEPTNHLDLDALWWLEQYLKAYQGTLILISHDRDFIDACCDRIVHIEHQQLFVYTGNYSDFENQRSEKLAQQQSSFERQQKEIAHIESFITRFKAKASKAKQAQGRIKALERMERIAPAHVDSPFHFSIPQPEKMSDPLLSLQKAQLGYADKIILDQVEMRIHPGSRLALLGPNGAGKSTLIKTLVDELELQNGQRTCGEHLEIGYFAQHQLEAIDVTASPVLHLQRLTPTASEQEIRNFLGGFNFRGDNATDPCKHFSGGEKARLALAIVVWKKPNLLLLDEPTNHLDLEMRHALTMALQDFDGALVLVSHDRHLLKNTADDYLLVVNGKVTEFEGDLDAYHQWLTAHQKQLSVSSKDKDKPAEDRKTQKRLEAAQRAKLSPVKKQLDKAEKALEKIQNKLAEVESGLAEADIYLDENKKQLQELLGQQVELKQQESEAEENWMELQEALDELQSSL